MNPNKSVNPNDLQKKKQAVFRIELPIGVEYLRENSSHRKIRGSLLGSAVIGSCPRITNRCMLGFTNQHAGSYAPATELDLIMFWPLPLGETVWNLSTQVNDSLISSYIDVFDLRRGKRRCFNPFPVYNLVYPSISSNLVTLSTLSPYYDSVCMHTCYPFSGNPLLS